MKRIAGTTFSIVGILFGGMVLYFIVPTIFSKTYNNNASLASAISSGAPEQPLPASTLPPAPIKPTPTHVSTPSVVKAIYVTSYAAGNPHFFKKLLDLVDTSEVNTVVIDVKDSTGHISFLVDDPELVSLGSAENRIPNIVDFINTLHSKGIYVIGRIATFQDRFLAKHWTDQAVVEKTNHQQLWPDYKCSRAIARQKESECLYWVDAGSDKVHEYVMRVGDQAYAVGFDELNFDYIRFPADGDMKAIYYPVSTGKIRTDVMNSFFTLLHDHFSAEHIPISADIFGYTTVQTDDLGIGQTLEPVLQNFDFVDPMVYPSHFPTGFDGFKNPAAKPYEVIHDSMGQAVTRAKAIGVDPTKLRPWLQDFDMGAVYTKDMVRTQIQATYDVGLTSWLMWDAANTYTTGAFLSADTTTTTP